MGNVCSAVRSVIDQVLRYVLATYAYYFNGGYIYMIDESFSSSVDADDPMEESSATDDDLNAVESQNCDGNDPGTTGNIGGLLKDIISNFFSSYNFQTNVLSGKVYEKNLINAEPAFQNYKNNRRRISTAADPPLTDFEFDQLDRNVRQEDWIPGLRHLRINEVGGNSERDKNVQIQSSRIQYENLQGYPEEPVDKTERLADEHRTVESNATATWIRSRKYGVAPTAAIFPRSENRAQKVFKNRYSVDEPKSTDQVSDGNGNRRRPASEPNLRKQSLPLVRPGCRSWVEDPSWDAKLAKYALQSPPLNRNRSRPRPASEHNLRKVSLPQLHSGCRILVEDSDADVKLSNYSLESAPIRVFVETHRKISHPNLYSGGLVACEELSKHLYCPDYYAENPIVYDELPEGVKFQRSSPWKIPPSQPVPRPTSCSGGGIVHDYSRRVSLTDVYPEMDPLMQPVRAQTSTQSSSSFGGLVTTEEDQQVIFSDLIRQSRQWEAQQSPNVGEKKNDLLPRSPGNNA